MNIWYPHYPADYLRDTYHLSFAEHGAYRLLLDHYYNSGGPLDAGVEGQRMEGIYKLTRADTDEERLALDKVLTLFFTLKNDKYHNARADKELRGIARRRNRLSEQGRNGAKKRWSGNRQSNSQANSQDIAITSHHNTAQDRLAPSSSTSRCVVGSSSMGGCGGESAYADTQLSASEIVRREPKLAARAANRQRHWPENFLLSENLRAYAEQHGIPASQVATEWEHFENHHKAKASRFMDWNRAWYTWVLRRPDFALGGHHAGETADERRRRETDEKVARVVASLQAKRAH